ncbi:DNA adenine methylase [Helicobacter canis]|uniref:site-specific DNA-methyltransferase (adenine-specific) n=1 Tax=Helicobacter canis TaxID=29419 RepID=A0A377J5K5_9HELI|nr:DNA adenine methylase [Helicobacter canis]STO97599.1 Adenine-specific DNA methylase [Helicobacter canis]
MIYTKPPLPFMGNKRNMLKHIKQVLETMRADGEIDGESIFIDVFGGSGLVAHNIKQWYPRNQVIWNDYDNYQKRLDHIPQTESLREWIYEKVRDGEYQNALPKEIKQEILAHIHALETQGEYIDYTTLSSYLLFSGNYARDFTELSKATFYNNISVTRLSAQGYLHGVERVSLDFIELLDSYKSYKNKCLILDPPYLQTQVGNYKDHFSLGQFFSLIERVQKPYLFFGSDRSDIIEVFEYFKRYHKELEDYTFNSAYLLGGNNTDYIIYPEGRSLFRTG